MSNLKAYYLMVFMLLCVAPTLQAVHASADMIESSQKVHRRTSDQLQLASKRKTRALGKDKFERIHPLANIAILLALGSISLFVQAFSFSLPALIFFGFAFALGGSVLSILTLIRIRKSSEKEKYKRERKMAVGALVLSALVLFTPLLFSLLIIE
ncbi:MAG: hypothetical protein AAF847_15730 [Bacteroidota bacterium]